MSENDEAKQETDWHKRVQELWRDRQQLIGLVTAAKGYVPAVNKLWHDKADEFIEGRKGLTQLPIRIPLKRTYDEKA